LTPFSDEPFLHYFFFFLLRLFRRFSISLYRRRREVGRLKVKRAVGTTQLHKIVVVYKGMDMPVCEEVYELTV
jgi:hypothetical protein